MLGLVEYLECTLDLRVGLRDDPGLLGLVPFDARDLGPQAHVDRIEFLVELLGLEFELAVVQEGSEFRDHCLVALETLDEFRVRRNEADGKVEDQVVAAQFEEKFR